MEFKANNYNSNCGMTNTCQYTEKTTEDGFLIQLSSTYVEDSLNTFSNLSLNIPEDSMICRNEKLEEKLEHSTSAEKSRSKLLFTIPPLAKVESIYDLKRTFKNPITGKVTELGAEQILSQACKQDNKSGAALGGASNANITEDGSCKMFLNLPKDANLQLNFRRNPITGDGVGQTSDYPLKSNSGIYSGIRINQPPGGMSSNIF